MSKRSGNPSQSDGVNGVHDDRAIKSAKRGTKAPALEGHEHHQLVLASFRCLIADLCQQYNMGHPGGAMGMAAIGVALWSYTMRYSPTNPRWFNRDRFVLSNGHTCLFQYTFLHLTGYKSMTFDMLKSYHSFDPHSLCAGHPEIEVDGIETTTGPLGQGIANAVGLAMATEHLAATYNRPGFDVVNNMTYCTTGDACFQEGVGLEAISLAGHWKLRRLVLIYDNNQITCDGSVDICNTEDVNAKMRASGWDVVDVHDGNYDITAIVDAVEFAKHKTEDKPTFINVRTTIGLGSQNEGKAVAHGAPFGAEDVRHIKHAFGMDPEQHFILPESVREFFQHKPQEGLAFEAHYAKLLEDYAKEYPDIAAEFDKRMRGEMEVDPVSVMPSKESFSASPLPGRKALGLILNLLARHINTFMVGTADLSPSVSMLWPEAQDFQHPSLQPASGKPGAYTGRYIHWGIREHAMCSISNGLAAFNPGTIIPITSSFLMFYMYAAAGVRMGALQHLPVIHVATHDSVGAGEDGPTHQPIELAAMFRAMPNILHIRPCDSEEAAGAVQLALSVRNSPSIISVSRQSQPQYPEMTSRNGVMKGAYVLQDDGELARVTLIGTGAELRFAIETAEHLRSEYGIQSRVVSMPCFRAFAGQHVAYIRETLKRHAMPAVAIEAYSMLGWERWADAGFGIATFGHSLPGPQAYQLFGFDGKVIADAVKGFLQVVENQGLADVRAEGFQELNRENYERALNLSLGRS